MPLDPDQKDELRFALRRYLAGRPSAAVPLDMIRHALVLKSLKATDQEIEDELTYWIGESQVKLVHPPHSAAKCWQITNTGRLADQRGD